MEKEGKEFSGKWQGHDLNLTDRPINFTGMVKVSVAESLTLSQV
ncbi:hypothetical protein KF134_1820 [Lactococcus lactis subsp. lactis]|nr:hypothetical protein [Lactococcus lactis]KST91114.1 hypothetical protein KF134_1820 [Lactococcus lactis subsp. lactis]